MTTTIELSDWELQQLCEVTRQSNVITAVETAMKEYIEIKRRRQTEKAPAASVSSVQNTRPSLSLPTFSVPADAEIIPGDLAAKLLADEMS